MTAKSYLNQIKHMDAKIARRKLELFELRDQLGSLRAIDYSADKVQGGNRQDRNADLLEKIERLSAEIEKETEELIGVRYKILQEIEQLENGIYTELLYKRYLESKSMAQIAQEMGYAEGYIRRMHGLALTDFEKKNQA